jgi:hypothetical protein
MTAYGFASATSIICTYTQGGVRRLALGEQTLPAVPAKAVRNGAAGVARAQSAALSAVAATGRLNVRARVIALYAELWRLDRTKALLVESRELMATAAEAAQARYESGEGIQEGLIRAQTVVRRADLDLIELALLRRQAEIALSAVLGRTDDPSFGPAGSLPEVAGAIDSEGVVATAIASSPEVAETSARQRAAEAELADARVQVKSTFSWLLAYQFRGGLDPMVMLSTAVYPALDGRPAATPTSCSTTVATNVFVVLSIAKRSSGLARRATGRDVTRVSARASDATAVRTGTSNR